MCDGSIFQKYVGPNYITVKLAGKITIICDLAIQNSILLEATETRIDQLVQGRHTSIRPSIQWLPLSQMLLNQYHNQLSSL